MLTHNITRYIPPTKTKGDKPKFVVGSFEHKKHILEKTVASIEGKDEYLHGEEWTVKGYSGPGVIIDVLDDINLVGWEGLKVKFIELWVYSQNLSVLCHPSDLKRK